MSGASVWNPGSDIISVNANHQILNQAFTAIGGQALFNLTAYQYAVGTGALLVFINGAALRPGVDFTETSATSFTLTTPASLNDKVLAVGFVGITGTVATLTGVAFSQAQTHAAGTVGNKLKNVVYANDAPFNATGDGVTDDTAAIQAAIDFAATNYTKAVVYLRYGTYMVSPNTRDGATNYYYALLPKSNVKVIGECSTIKFIDAAYNIARDPQVFYTTASIDNFQCEGIFWDGNAANNVMPTVGIVNNAFFFARYTTNGPKATRIKFKNCYFTNHPGSNILLITQTTAGVGAPLSDDVVVEDCGFYRVGLYTGDHSCINTFANNVRVRGCYFLNADTDTNALIIGCPFESHGNGSIFIGNNVENFLKGVMVSQNYTSIAKGNIVSGNTFNKITYAGVEINASVGAGAGAFAVNETVIDGNTILFNDNLSTTSKLGLSLLTAVPCSNVKFTNNIVKKTSRTNLTVRCIGVYCPTGADSKATGRFELVECLGNTFENLTLPAMLVTGGAISWVKRFVMKRNTSRNALDIGGANGWGIGYFEGDATYKMQLDISDNTALDDTGTTQWGIELADYIEDWKVKNNNYINITTPLKLGGNMFMAGHTNKFVLDEPVMDSLSAYVAADTTPSVLGVGYMKITNAGAIVITQLDDGVPRQMITLEFADGNTTIDSAANILLAGGADFVGTADDTLTLRRNLLGTKWIEQSRSVNA